MSRILLFLENRENARLLAEALASRHELLFEAPQEGGFDLAVLDGPCLRAKAEFLVARKHEEDPVLLPALLVTSRQNIGIFTGPMLKLVDEVVLTPVEKVELFARIEMLLRARRLSLELRLQKEDLEAFIHAMTHDLRAPLRTMSGFAEAMAEDQSARLDATGRHQLNRIQAAVREMWELIESLVEFSRIGRKQIKLRSLEVNEVARQCIADLEREIEAGQGRIQILGDLGAVEADPALLKIAICNLLSNGLKYVAKGVRPNVEIWAEPSESAVRLMFRDNGIGLAEEDQYRIFTPFVRLHGVEDYPGLGLGLSATRKVVEIMGGHTGVISAPGQGSTFWIELGAGAKHEDTGR